jgi:hypothetical protein
VNATKKAEGEILYGVKAIAKFLGVTRRQAQHLVDSKAVPSFKMGRTVCARPERVRSVIEAAENGRAAPSDQVDQPQDGGQLNLLGGGEHG